MTVKSTPEDARALALRREGQSFAAIAKAQGYPRARDAQDAFNRALRATSSAEQEAIRTEENGRLDRLVARLRARGDLDEAELENRLGVIARLRAALMAD